MTNQKVPSKVPSISNVSTLDAANGQSRTPYYGPGLAEILGPLSWGPTDVAFACMLHLQDLQREGYRARKAQEASNICEANSTLAIQAQPLHGHAGGSPGPRPETTPRRRGARGRPPPPGFAGAL